MEHRDGSLGVVAFSQALYAVIDWDDGRREEIDQFDPAVAVLERAGGE